MRRDAVLFDALPLPAPEVLCRLRAAGCPEGPALACIESLPSASFAAKGTWLPPDGKKRTQWKFVPEGGGKPRYSKHPPAGHGGAGKTVHSDLDKLHAEVAARPDDWRARLVLADALEESGNQRGAEAHRRAARTMFDPWTKPKRGQPAATLDSTEAQKRAEAFRFSPRGHYRRGTTVLPHILKDVYEHIRREQGGHPTLRIDRLWQAMQAHVPSITKVEFHTALSDMISGYNKNPPGGQPKFTGSAGKEAQKQNGHDVTVLPPDHSQWGGWGSNLFSHISWK